MHSLHTFKERERECATAKQRDRLKMRLCREMHTSAYPDLNSQLCRGQQDKDEEKKREKEENRMETDEEVGKRCDVMVTENCSLKGREEKQAGCRRLM